MDRCLHKMRYRYELRENPSVTPHAGLHNIVDNGYDPEVYNIIISRNMCLYVEVFDERCDKVPTIVNGVLYTHQLTVSQANRVLEIYPLDNFLTVDKWV